MCFCDKQKKYVELIVLIKNRNIYQVVAGSLNKYQADWSSRLKVFSKDSVFGMTCKNM